MLCAIIAHASEPQRGEKDKKAQAVLERIEKQRTQPRWMVLLLSAQYYAYEQAFQTTYRLLLSRDALSQNKQTPKHARINMKEGLLGKQYNHSKPFKSCFS